MTTFTILSTAVWAATDAHNARLQNAFMAKLELAQSRPTVGVDGRLHAPHDGYVWGDSVFMGGQYLPEDEEQGKLGKAFKVKFCINVKLFDDFNTLFGGGSMGKTWVKNGEEVGYFYTTISAVERTAILKIMPTLFSQSFEKRKIVEVKEDDDVTSKVWKWSDAKVHNKIMKADLDIELAECLFSAGLTWYFEEGRKIKGKLREWFTGLDGKMVRYEYVDDTIYS